MRIPRAMMTAVMLLLAPAAVGGEAAAVGASPSGQSASADGRYVVFASPAPDGSRSDVFLRDHASGTITLISRAAIDPVISADGASVVFVSTTGDVFLYERATRAMTLVSRSVSGPVTAANGASAHAVLSADGAYVAFESSATDLVPGQTDTPGTADVFLYDRATRTMTVVSRVPGSKVTTADSASTKPVISADGEYVAFQSLASNLVEGQADANGERDVFLYERATGIMRLASHLPGAPGKTGNGPSSAAVVSVDGAYVAFESRATNLVGGQRDTNAGRDVFLYERTTGAVTLVSHAPGSAATAGDRVSFAGVISEDGGFVMFESLATNLVAGQTMATRGVGGVYMYERATGAIAFVTYTSASTLAASDTQEPDGGTIRSARK